LLKLPLLAEQDETITFPVSGRIWKRKRGDCLDPKRWSAKVVKRRQQNRLVWAGQFQQSPVSVEGNLIRTDDILFFGGRDPQTGAIDPGLPESFDRKIISVDCSFKDLRTSDYVAVIVVGVLGSRRYLLHVTNAHLDLTGTENEIRNAHATFGPISAVLVEDKANGPAVISHLKDHISGMIAVNPEGGKVARVVAASPEFQANNWIIERNGPWAHKVVEQLTMFPNAKNDDIVDAITQAAIWLQANTGGLGLLDVLKDFFTGKRKMPRSAEEILQGVAIKPVTVDNFQIWLKTHQAPACPLCKSTATTYNERQLLRCNQCSAIDGVPPPAPVGSCCGNFLPQVIGGGGIRCGSCGTQTMPVGTREPAPTLPDCRSDGNGAWHQGARRISL
jgi:predicted phage terminase large subunit-like protein